MPATSEKKVTEKTPKKIATKIAIATFVKTPGMSPIKTRLAADIGAAKALEFYITSLGQTFNCIEDVKKLAADVHGAEDAHLSEDNTGIKKQPISIEAFWAVAEEAALENPFWSKWPRRLQGGGGLGERLNRVYSELQREFDIVALYGADSPHVPAQRLWNGLQQVVAGTADTVVGPTEDGGFYFLASSLPVQPEVWTSVTYSAPTTLEQLKKRWPGPMQHLETDYDVDTVEDLTRLALEAAVFEKFKN